MSKEIDNSVFEKMFEKLYERYGKVNDDQDLIPIIYDKIQLSAEKAKEKGLPYLGNPRELANFVEKIRNGRPNYIKTVIVGDNPGKNEMKYGEFFSWKGLSGMALRNFFYRSLGRHRRCSDEIIPVREFWESEYKAIILNKTGYHTVSTGQLKDLKNDPDFIADQILWADLAEAIVATSEWMSTGEF